MKGGEPTDATGHGNHVAGTILGNDLKGNSLLGIAPEAKWIAAKVFDKDGETTPKQLLDAGQWILAPTDKFGNAHPEMAPKIINASWGGNSDDEFFVAYSQKDDTSNDPVLGIDEDTKGLGNYYKMINNAWNEPSEVGSYMIRVNLSEIDFDKDLNNNTIKKMIKEDFNKGKDDNII
ncbi:S8 family serine peptidase [Helcococcus bovis]